MNGTNCFCFAPKLAEQAKSKQAASLSAVHHEDLQNGSDAQLISALSPGLCYLFLQACSPLHRLLTMPDFPAVPANPFAQRVFYFSRITRICVARFLLQAFCFTVLMLLIARLRILALPLLCVLASLIASEGLWSACIERLLSVSGQVMKAQYDRKKSR